MDVQNPGQIKCGGIKLGSTKPGTACITWGRGAPADNAGPLTSHRHSTRAARCWQVMIYLRQATGSRVVNHFTMAMATAL